MGKLKYTKEHLEQIVFTQLENLEAMGDMLKLIREQNELIKKYNIVLGEEIEGLYKKVKPYSKRGKL